MIRKRGFAFPANQHLNPVRQPLSASSNPQGLRAQVSKQKEDVDRLEEEAVEMREKLKKLAKLEKNEKGHNAMTEELRKMEEETGLSVSLLPAPLVLVVESLYNIESIPQARYFSQRWTSAMVLAKSGDKCANCSPLHR